MRKIYYQYQKYINFVFICQEQNDSILEVLEMESQWLVVGVISSAREGSNSAVLVREALRGAEKKGIKIREIYLPAYGLDYCTGCLTCMKTGKCRLPDSFNELRDEIYEADGIIWGSPTYAGAPNAIMKNLIDRLGMYEMSTSSLGGKYMVGISSASSAGAAKKVAKSLSRIGISGTFMRSYRVGSLGAGFKGSRQAGREEALLAKVSALGEKMAEDIQSAKRYPLQGLSKRILNYLLIRPAFGSYIKGNKAGETKILYENLTKRNLLA
jgi:multimeric flavodoxin WrbA